MENQEVKRNVLFISHANPEDNDFTKWLAARLSAAGYDVWSDLRLEGGQDWQRQLENVLHNKTCKVLLVGTEHGIDKQGVRNEISIACKIGKKLKDSEFIIPLRLTHFTAPFLIEERQYIDFESWSNGLAELLSTLESYKVPRERNDTTAKSIDFWKDNHLHHKQRLVAAEENLMSNWLGISKMPKRIYLCKGVPKSQGHDAMQLPIQKFADGFLTFSRGHVEKRSQIKESIDVQRFLKHGWSSQNIKKAEAGKIAVALLQHCIEIVLQKKCLVEYPMHNHQKAWWGNIDSVPLQYIKFAWNNGVSGKRMLIGYSEKRERYWHYAITPKTRLHPFPHIRIISRIVFSKDGKNSLQDSLQMFRLRRSFVKSWRNARWRDMMLALLFLLSNGKSERNGNREWVIPVGDKESFSLRLPPMRFISPVSISETGEEDEVEDELDVNDDSMQDIDYDFLE